MENAQQEQAIKDLDERWFRHWNQMLKSVSGAFYDTTVINEFSVSEDKIILARVGRDNEDGQWCHEMLFNIAESGEVRRYVVA